MNSRQKGKRGERELAGYLREQGWVKARRSQQYAGHPEAGSGDVVCSNFPFHIEAKRCQQVMPEKWLFQAMSDAPQGKVPSVWFRRNGNKNWMVLMSADDVCDLARQIAPPIMERPSVVGDVVVPTTLVVKGEMISTPTTNPNKT